MIAVSNPPKRFIFFQTHHLAASDPVSSRHGGSAPFGRHTAGKHAATLRGRLAADFTGWEQDNAKFEAAFERVVEALRSDERAWEAPPEPQL